MFYILLTLIIVGAVVLGVTGVVGYFTSGARRSRKELAVANRRVSIAQTALIEIAAGDAMPVLRASDALAKIGQSYIKEIK